MSSTLFSSLAPLLFASESTAIPLDSEFSQFVLSLSACFPFSLQLLSPCTYVEHQQLPRVRSAHSICPISLTTSLAFPNSTTTYPLGPAVTQAPTGSCSTNCTYPQYHLHYISWSQQYITATYTVETVVFVVNKKNNSTRTTTISNTEIDFAKIVRPTNTNSDGTVTASVVDNDGSTRIV